MTEPRGHYLAVEAGRLAGVQGTTIGQWARRGYIRSSRAEAPVRIYSFQDVAEAMVVHELVERGVAMRAVKAAVDHLRARAGHDWPLQQAQLLVPERGRSGRTIVVAEDGGHIDVVAGHPVLAQLDLVAVAGELRRGGWAARDLPGLQHVEVDPDRLSGRPVIRGKRVPAELAARMA
ncbi:MAG TPA: MerR family transcriptional regulator, partial [Acidimicrobiales bacterium]|nr:MerR family transcriptional regulator [Acidimicrobiales bacterium]